MALYKLDY